MVLYKLRNIVFMQRNDSQLSFLYDFLPKEFIDELDNLHLNDREIKTLLLGLNVLFIYKRASQPYYKITWEYAAREHLVRLYVESKLMSNKNKYELKLKEKRYEFLKELLKTIQKLIDK